MGKMNSEDKAGVIAFLGFFALVAVGIVGIVVVEIFGCAT